jgi:hypothetical protein
MNSSIIIFITIMECIQVITVKYSEKWKNKLMRNMGFITCITEKITGCFFTTIGVGYMGDPNRAQRTEVG